VKTCFRTKQDSELRLLDMCFALFWIPLFFGFKIGHFSNAIKSDNDSGKYYKYVCITTNQPVTKSNALTATLLLNGMQ